MIKSYSGKKIRYLKGGGGVLTKKNFRFPLDAMLSYAISNRILTKMCRSWLKECDYQKIMQYSDQNSVKIVITL